jgi:D-alanyl-lipoteichoic acid acyltransferase DltB (MBOAT superfamily)
MKFVIANRLNPSVLLNSTDPLISIICATVFELKFYFDFAGYSFIAYGLALLVGIKLTINFNHPFITRNVVEFWRNWHITLGAFLKKYIYLRHKNKFSSRKSVVLFACMIFIISAMWHGVTLNYLLWGLFHGSVYFTYLIIVKNLNIPKFYGIIGMILFFIFGRMLAIDANSSRLLHRLNELFNFSAYLNIDLILLDQLNLKSILLAFIFIAFEWYQIQFQKRDHYHLFRRQMPIFIIAIIFLFYGINSGELLYARF